MSVADTAKDVIRIASTAGLAKDVIDLMEKKLALITGELDTATQKNTLLEQRISQLEADNGQLQKKLAVGQTHLGDGETRVIGIIASAEDGASDEELARLLNIQLNMVNYYLGNLKTLGLAEMRTAIPNRGGIWTLTQRGLAHAASNNLVGNHPPGLPRRQRGPFRA